MGLLHAMQHSHQAKLAEPIPDQGAYRDRAIGAMLPFNTSICLQDNALQVQRDKSGSTWKSKEIIDRRDGLILL